MKDNKLLRNLAIAFIRWVVLGVMARLMFLPPNRYEDAFLRKLLIAAAVYNLLVTFPGKSLQFRLANSLTALCDLTLIAAFTYYSPLHNHYWVYFFMLPILYSGIESERDGTSLVMIAAGVAHGGAALLQLYMAGKLIEFDSALPYLGPVVGFILLYIFFGIVVVDLIARAETERRAGRKMNQVTEQLGATVRFLGVAGEKAQRSAEQLAAAINLIGTTAYSGVSVQAGMDSIFEQLIKGAVEVLQAERGVIMLAEESSGDLLLKSAWGQAQDNLPARVAPGEDVTGWVAQNGQSLIITKDNFPADLSEVVQARRVLDCLAAPIKIDGRVAGVLALENKLNGTFDPEDMKVMNTVAGEAAMVIVNARLYQETMEKKEALERMIVEVQTAQEKERRRIARDLHDGTAQSLARLALELGLLKLGKKTAKTMTGEIEKLENEVDATITDLRSLIYDLRPASLDNFGLVPTLEQYLKKFTEQTGIKVKFTAELPGRLAEDHEINLFRFTQESLNNVKKHAGVKRAEVILKGDAEIVRLTIKDKGKGFDPEKIDVLGSKSQSFGLLGMKERIESLGGTVSINSEPGTGTEIIADLRTAVRNEALIETA